MQTILLIIVIVIVILTLILLLLLLIIIIIIVVIIIIMIIIIIICMRGGYIIQRHSEIRDLNAEILQVVCTDVEIEPVLQEVTGKVLPRGTNKAPNARLDICARGFRAREQCAFFDVRICYPNADSYKNHTPEQIYKLQENDKKAPLLV